MTGWIKSSRPWKVLKGLNKRNVFRDSLLSSALMGGLAAMSIQFFDADPKSSVIVATFSTIILSCILVAEGENQDREG
ncbi:membrane protein [Streptomyces phage RosePharie]|nr:membrane protein [Streptomyces phage RosePharie]